MRGSRQLGHKLVCGTRRASCARRLSRRAFECRRFGFGIIAPLLLLWEIVNGRGSDDPFTIYHSSNLSARTSEGQLPSAHNRTRQHSDHFRTEDRYPNSHFYKERELVPPEKSAPSRFHRGQ